MTIRAIEDQYAVHDETIAEVNDLLNRILDLANDKDISVVLAALCLAAVDVVHQEDVEEDARFNLVMSSVIAAWTDYHANHPPPKSEQH